MEPHHNATAEETKPKPLSHADAAIVKRAGEGEGDEPMASPRDTAEPLRWNRDEHARFMQALETFGGERTGDEWCKIAAFVQTRSLDEVRVHGQQYLQHLVQIHHVQHQHQQHQHQLQQQQQQQRLLHLGRMGMGGDPHAFPNQNDLNGPNSMVMVAMEVKPTRSKGTSKGPSPLSVAAQSVANAMNAHARKPPTQATAFSGGAQRGKLKTWTFHEDKVMETTLAAWQRGKPYSWPKIAAVLPGKTAKDVRLRYEQLVDDVATIDKGRTLHYPPPAPPPPPKIPHTSNSTYTSSGSSSSSAAVGRPPPHSGLSSRRAPPPPILVPPPTSRGKTESPGIFPTSLRGRFAITPSFGGVSGMLSPTFLDFLASEDKPPLPAFTGLSDLPSPLLPSPLGLDLSATPSGARSRRVPRSATTPRIWHDFLADDFKFEPKGPSASPMAATKAEGEGEGEETAEETAEEEGEGEASSAAQASAATISNDSTRRSEDLAAE